MTVSSCAWFLPSAGLLTLILLICDIRVAQANPAMKDVCLYQGIVAEKLASARDNGLTMREAIENVLDGDSSAKPEQVFAEAVLVFHRFRHLPANKAAFEFALACMDDAQ